MEILMNFKKPSLNFFFETNNFTQRGDRAIISCERARNARARRKIRAEIARAIFAQVKEIAAFAHATYCAFAHLTFLASRARGTRVRVIVPLIIIPTVV